MYQMVEGDSDLELSDDERDQDFTPGVEEEEEDAEDQMSRQIQTQRQIETSKRDVILCGSRVAWKVSSSTHYKAWQRTIMHSCAWINGQYQQVGPPSQSSQAAIRRTHDARRNQQAGPVNNSSPYRTWNTASQCADFIHRNGLLVNRKQSNRATSTFHQAVFSQQPAGENTNNHLPLVSNGNLQNLSSNTQSGNYGLQCVTQQAFQQNSMGNGNQSIRAQDGNVECNLQHILVQKSSFQNVNGDSSFPVSAYSTTATSLPQTAHNQNHRQNGSQHGFSSSMPPPSYYSTVNQYLTNKSITANSSPIQQNSHSMSQKPQQHSTHNSGGEATSINSNSYSQQHETSHFLSKTNYIPINPAVDTRQQMPSHQMLIARIADNLQKSFIPSSDSHPPVCSSSPYSGTHFVSEARMTQPVSTVAKGYNSYASQSLPLNSGQSLPTTTHNVMSRTQHSVDVPFQQSSVPDVSRFTTAGDGVGSKAANACFPESNRVGSLSDASQLVQLPETNSSVPNTCEELEILERLSSVKSSDGSIHSSAGHTGARAVAVVQPLSQESYLVATRQPNSPNTINQTAKCTATDTFLNNPNDLSSKKSADDTRSEVAINIQVDHRVAPTAQQSVTSKVPLSQPGDEDKSENSADPKSWDFDLSSVPWTIAKLGTFIQEAEKKVQMKLKGNTNELDPAMKMINMFWDGQCKNLVCKLKTGWYKDLIIDVTEFCSKHITPNTVVLSQAKYDFEKLKIVHVLKDNEVYSEPPYKSSWLNVNEQLDDIDKEFGFHWSLKHCLYVLESDSQPDPVGTGNSTPTQIVSEVSNEVLSQTELEPVDAHEENQASPVKISSTQTISPNKTEGIDSSNPYYSFEIHVLPPEEAKAIFEQVQSKMPQSMDTDLQPERVMDSSVEGELPEVTDVPLSYTKLKESIKTICCINRWMETILGSSVPSMSKCQCNSKQSHKDVTDKTLGKEEMDVQKKDKLCAIRSESIADDQATGENTIDFTQDNDEPHSYSDKEPKIISKISIHCSESSIILLSDSEDDVLSSENEIPNQMPDFEKDSEQAQIKLTESVQSSGSDSSEKKEKTFGDTEIQSDPEVDGVQGQVQSTGSTTSCTSDKDKETEDLSSCETEVASQMTDIKENCGQTPLTSTNVPESSLESKEQTQISVTAAPQTTFSLSGKPQTVKTKQSLSSQDASFLFLKKSKKRKLCVNSQPVPEGVLKCRKVFVDATDSEPLASDIRTVKLALFGSAAQDKWALIGNRKRHILSVSDGAPRPPEVLTVNLSPLRRKSSESVLTGEYSVKRRILEKCFSPAKIRRRSKLKTQKCTFTSLSGVNFKKAERVVPTNSTELPVSSEMRTWNRNTEHCLSLKRRRHLSKRLKLGEKKKKNAVSLKQPADQERWNAEKASRAVMPLLEKNVLRFSVLPNTFNFKDGPNRTKKTNDPVPDNPHLIEGKDKSHTQIIMRAQGTWCPNPEKNCPMTSPPAPKTSILFHEFKRKYMDMVQPFVDE